MIDEDDDAARAGDVRELLARAARTETAPSRDLAHRAVKQLRFRRHAVANANEVFGTVGAFFSGLAALWGADMNRHPRAPKAKRRDA